jgi:ceramide glucosyltransferase
MLLLRWLVLLFALAPFVYYLISIYCTYVFFSKTFRELSSSGSFAPAISILKPVRGMDREAYENFASYCRQDYPEYEVLFAVADVDDPAIRVIVRLIRDFPACSIRLLVGAPALGASGKVNKLCRLVREAKHDLLVINDSDVRVDQNYLREVAAPFATPGLGAVTAFYRGMAEGSLGAKLEGLALSTETVPNALVAKQLEGKVQFVFGWTVATTKQHLASIGGFEAMVNHHSDDFELGNRIAAQGLRIEFLQHPVWMVFPKETLREYLRHELRWSIGLRNVRPSGYCGLLLTFGLPWALLAGVAAPSMTSAGLYLLSYMVLRLGQVWMAGVWGLHDSLTRKNLWLVPLRDALNFVVWVVGLFASKITWRGLQFRVKKGLLIPLASSKAAGD